MKKSKNQSMAAYFRVWRDVASNPSINKASMLDIPKEVDMAFVFPSGRETEPFWEVLKNDYVPALHAKGIKVLYTLGVNLFINTDYPNTPEGYADLARHFYETILVHYNLDGFDVDVEQYFENEEFERVTGVFAALSKYVGPQSGTDKLFVYDTNKSGYSPILRKVYPLVDYVLFQAYGHGVEYQQYYYDTYKDIIPPEKYMIGFSFYEENGVDYGDVTDPIEQSRAWQFAEWQPAEGRKAGIFCYAIDRDGARYGDDDVIDPQYNDTKALLKILKPQ